MAVKSLHRESRPWTPGSVAMKIIAGISGALSGFFGLPGLLVDLPATTLFILYAIADIARESGHDLSTPEGRMDCMFRPPDLGDFEMRPFRTPNGDPFLEIWSLLH